MSVKNKNINTKRKYNLDTVPILEHTQSIDEYRNRERNIAKSLIQKPTIINSIKALGHYGNSLLGRPKNKHLITGTPPSVVPTKIKSFLELMSYVMPKEGYKQLLTTGSVSGIKKYFYPKGKTKIISNNIKEDIINTVGNRLADKRPWLKKDDIIRDVENNIPNNYIEYPQYVFDRAFNKKNILGNYYNGTINLSNNGGKNVLKHEIRHRLDEVFPYTEQEEQIVNKAFGEHFNTIVKKMGAKNETSTTINDFRNNYLRPQELNLNINDQNNIIDDMSDNTVFDVLENANGYGENYVKFLKRLGYNTHEKAEAIKTAAKHIGISSGIYPVIYKSVDKKSK